MANKEESFRNALKTSKAKKAKKKNDDAKNDAGVTMRAEKMPYAIDRKRASSDSPNSGEKAKRARYEQEEAKNGEDFIVDKAAELGFKAGDRLEVEWEVNGTQHNWGGTLLEHDGETKEGYAIRKIDYDPYPEGGYPTRSAEPVVFITQYLLIDPASGQQLNFKREGEDSCISFNEDVLNEILTNSLQKNKAKWSKLDAAQQAQFGELIRNGKERLLDVISRRSAEKPGEVIRTEEVPDILEQAFQGM